MLWRSGAKNRHQTIDDFLYSLIFRETVIENEQHGAGRKKASMSLAF
ncbi:hypothetical protein BN131_3856 [Cronobacter malonaticus 681]|nr:hypothetical protein BN131_3856 [Cronobacter malonaticus 681]